MALESIEKLLSDDASLAILEKRLLSCTGRSFIGDALNAIAADIEAEIAERYMELPVDADGVPIRVGDELYNGEVIAFGGLAEGGVVFVHRGFEDGNYILEAFASNVTHHVKQRTVEDVLRELVNDAEWEQSPDSYEEIERRLITLYAAELRGLLGVDR